MVTRANSGEADALSPDEASWLMAISQTLTLQDEFEVVPELLEHILGLRRQVPRSLADEMVQEAKMTGLHRSVNNDSHLQRESQRMTHQKVVISGST